MALQAPNPQAIVLFGASGDLAKKKIIPALYELSLQGLLPKPCKITFFSSAYFCIAGARFATAIPSR